MSSLDFKFCSKCEQDKPRTEFYKRSASKDGLGHCCKVCAHAKGLAWYHENKNKTRGQRAEAYKRWYSKLRSPRPNVTLNSRRDLFVELRVGLSCELCGENHISCLDFHHKDPKVKSFTISKAIKLGTSLDLVEAEIKKCQVLCSNCHRKLHWKLRND